MTPGPMRAQAGKVPKFIKSEETPKDNDGPVKVVTANTFEEVVFGGKDILIEFYAPWCGHCKSLAPIYEQVHLHLYDAVSVDMLSHLLFSLCPNVIAADYVCTAVRRVVQGQ